jgi:endoglucanase
MGRVECILSVTLQLFLVAVVCVLLPWAQGQTSAPGIGVSGNKIIATTGGTLGLHAVSAGQVLDLRGVNFSGSEYTCSGGTGFWDNPTGNQTTINHMRNDWHANVIRLPLNEECWLGINGVPPATSGAKYQNAISTFVNLATASAMVMEVDLHFGSGGSGNPKNDNYPGLDADHAPAFWQSVANAFKGNPSVIFNLINEPHDSGSISWACYLNGGCTVKGGTGSWTVVGTQSVVDTIRGTGATNPIIIAGLNWSNDLTQWLQWKPTDSANAIIAGAHNYFDNLGCQDPTCWTRVWQNIQNNGYPVLVDELGQFKRCDHSKIDILMNWADAANPPIGYWAWAFTVASCTRGPSLITKGNGTPTQTYGQGFHDHLRAVQ